MEWMRGHKIGACPCIYQTMKPMLFVPQETLVLKAI